MPLKTKKIIIFILVFSLLATSLSGSIYMAVKNSIYTNPQDSSNIISGKKYIVANITDDEYESTYIFFNDKNSVVWYQSNDKTYYKNGEYHLYTGTDITRLYYQEKEINNLSLNEIKNVKETVNSFVEDGIVESTDDVIYIRMTNLMEYKDAKVKSVDDLIFFGTKDKTGNLKLKETTTSTYYIFEISS